MPKAGITYGPRIKAPNFAQIAEDARQAVLAEFRQLGVAQPEDVFARPREARPEDVALKAAEIIGQADAEIGLYVGERDRALAHLWFYEQRIGLGRSLGLSQTGYRANLAKTVYGDKAHPLPAEDSSEALVAAAQNAGLERVDNAEDKLIETHTAITVARARRDAAMPFMQEAVLALSVPPYNWSPVTIAEHVDGDRKVIHKQRNAAAKRHGLL